MDSNSRYFENFEGELDGSVSIVTLNKSLRSNALEQNARRRLWRKGRSWETS